MDKEKKKKENIILKKYIPLLSKHYKIHELTKEHLKRGVDNEECFIIKEGSVLARDISGKIIGSFENLTSTGRVLIRDSEYAPGLYFTTLEVNGVVASTKRFVVAK